MTERQNEAFELAQDIAHRPEVRLSMNFQQGDIQLINNHTTLHGRSEYEDHEEPERKRPLLRLWIALPDDVRRPPSPRLAERRSEERRVGKECVSTLDTRGSPSN